MIAIIITIQIVLFIINLNILFCTYEMYREEIYNENNIYRWNYSEWKYGERVKYPIWLWILFAVSIFHIFLTAVFTTALSAWTIINYTEYTNFKENNLRIQKRQSVKYLGFISKFFKFFIKKI